MHQIFCSTGSLLGRPNGRNYRLLTEYCPQLDCDGFEFILYNSWYDEMESLTAFLRSLHLNIPVMHCEKTLSEHITRGGDEEWQEAFDEDPSANEDARFVLPNACSTRLVMTMNTRELRHFFSLRCCERAQWEIRFLATRMLTLCRQAAPVLFDDAGPSCVAGPCPEGARSCGRAAEIREQFKNLNQENK